MPIPCKALLRVIGNFFYEVVVFIVDPHFMKSTIGLKLDISSTRMSFFRQGVFATNAFQYFYVCYFTNCFITVFDFISAGKSSSSAHHLTTFLEER